MCVTFIFCLSLIHSVTLTTTIMRSEQVMYKNFVCSSMPSFGSYAIVTPLQYLSFWIISYNTEECSSLEQHLWPYINSTGIGMNFHWSASFIGIFRCLYSPLIFVRPWFDSPMVLGSSCWRFCLLSYNKPLNLGNLTHHQALVIFQV